MKLRILALALMLIPFILYAQYDQEPGLLHWRQIKTEHFIIVFPAGISARAIETAALLEKVYQPASQSMKVSPKRISLFLFNQSAVSNGFTALAPRYVGFYTTPPQDANLVGGSDWLQSLATHEYRHVVQYSKFDENFTNFMGHVMGDIGKAIMMNWSIPVWYFEGDAVCTETILTSDGRGRLPSFSRDLRAMELENVRYSYDKAYLGSYKDYIPDYYHMGYLMTSYVTKNFGTDTWNKITDRVSNLSFSPFSFSGSLRKFTRSNLKNTYKNAFNELHTLWSQKIENYPVTPFEKFYSKPSKVWTSYTQPFFISSDSLIALKTGLESAPALVLITKNKEKKLIRLDPIDRIHSNGRFIVWSSEKADLRWGLRSYSNIMMYDLKKKTRKKLTHKGKYYAPAVSPDGTMIAAVEFTSNMKCLLTILDIAKHSVKMKFDIPDSCFIRMPAWSEDGKNIVFTETTGQLKSISVLNLEQGIIKNMFPYNEENISNPVFFKNYILYNSPASGIDAIFAINPEDGSKYLVTAGKYGVYNPNISPDKTAMAFQNYTRKGFEIGSSDIDFKSWIPVENVNFSGDDYYKNLLQENKSKNIFDTIIEKTQDQYKIKKYIPILHSINIHSWQPIYGNGGIGLSVYSNDKLNTTSLYGGFEYFPSANATFGFADFEYAGLFPVFDFILLNGRRFTKLNYRENFKDTTVFAKMNEKLAKVKVSFPFNFSANTHVTTLLVSFGYDYVYDNVSFVDLVRYNTIDRTAVEAGIEFNNYQEMAHRDLYPRFGQNLIMSYWSSSYKKFDASFRLNTWATFYFPGFARNHSISLSAGYERNTSDFVGGVYEVTTDQPFVRGFEWVSSREFMHGLLIYAMPLFYPDIHVGPIINLKRVHSEFFCDYGVIKNNNLNTFNSTGFDLIGDVNFFRLLTPFQIGIRYSYRISDNRMAIDFLLMGVNF